MKTIYAESSIHAIGAFIQEHIEQNWKVILRNHPLKLLKAYEELSEAAYGVYFQLLLEPVIKELRKKGFRMRPKLPGDLNISREWGEENYRERWIWTAIKYADGRDCGTIVTAIFHDHTDFRIPEMPLIRTLMPTAKKEVIDELSAISPDFARAKDTKTEYAEYLEYLAGQSVQENLP
jgi:hypothetical protein